MKTKILSLFAGLFVILLAAVYIIFFVGSQIFYDFSFKLPFTRSNNTSSGLVQGATIVNSNVSGDLKIYSSNLGFKISYPKNWGLLTCSNSYNFELDPTNGSDMSNVICDYAIKPISIVLSNDTSNCGGQTVRIGNINALKSEFTTQNYTTYQWCTLTQPSLIISNRTSNTTNFAATTTNYSADIEAMIKTLQFTSR